jgi:alkylated DNA repair protein (DNA oxidative demethylase)
MMGTPEGLLYVAKFLSPEEQTALLHELHCLTYTHDTFRGQTMKRGWAQFGYSYVSIGQKLKPAPPMPAFLQAVIEKARPYYPSDSRFEQLIITHYPPGAGIAWHTDAPRFGDCILGVSLAAPARLQFRPNKAQAVSYEVTAAPGSLYVLQGISRWHYQHRIVPVKAERYSLTFRSVAEQKK